MYNKLQKFLPILIHNLNLYDSKLILKELNKKDIDTRDADICEIAFIAASTEEFRKFRKLWI